MKFSSRLAKTFLFLAIVYVLLVAITCIPCSDDFFFRKWEFSSLKDMFALRPCNWGDYTFAIPYNGRYLGNIIGLLLGKSYNSFIGHVVRVLVLMGGMVGFFALLSQFVSASLKQSLFLLTVLVLTPVNLYTQTMHWTAGFSNYFLPMLGVLLIFEKLKIQDPSCWDYMQIAMIACCTQLFAEHVTVYLLLVALFCAIRCSRKMPLSRAVFFGAFLGAVIMFSNPGYYQISSDAYRSVGIQSMLSTAKILAYDVLIGNGVLLFVIGLCFLVSLHKQPQKKHLVCSCVYAAYAISVLYSCARTITVSTAHERYRNLDIIIALVILFALCYLTWNLVETNKYTCVFYLVSIVVINGMLMLLSPITARCAWISFVLLILFAFSLAEDVGLFERSIFRNQLLLLAVCSLFYVGYLSFSYIQNLRVQMQWEQYCTQCYEQEIKVMYVPKFPYPHLMYDGNSLVYYLYGIYYEEPNDIYMEMHDYAIWCQLIQQQISSSE